MSILIKVENKSIFTNTRTLNIHNLDVNNNVHFSLLAQRYYDLQIELMEIETLLMQGEKDESCLDDIWFNVCQSDNRYIADKCNEEIGLTHSKSQTQIEYEDSEIPF